MPSPSDQERLVAALEQTARENRFLTTLHRWYCFYERDEKNFDHQFELITDDFTIVRPKESAMPSVTGKDAYRQSLLSAPGGQKNAHWFKSLVLERSADTSKAFKAVVTHAFQTAGPARTGAASLRYDVEVADVDALLPRFSKLQEAVVSLANEPFQDAYVHNRAGAFVYRWLSLLERSSAGPGPLRELLAPGFDMHLSTGATLNTWEAVEQWYGSSAGQVRSSAHHVKNLSVVPGSDGTCAVSMDFEWEGIGLNEQPLIAHTRHNWTLLDDGERYAKLKSFRVQSLTPFTPVSVGEALAHHERAR
jgi:hypothetical protein